MIEDYDRIDHEHNRASGRKVIALSGRWDDLGKIYVDPVAIWRNWAVEVQGFGIDSGHHVAEENPTALALAIGEFLR
jgi:haloacetate dehalogenase